MVPCGRLCWIPLSFWAHVNRIESCCIAFVQRVYGGGARNFCLQTVQNIPQLQDETIAIGSIRYFGSFSSDLWKSHRSIWSWLGDVRTPEAPGQLRRCAYTVCCVAERCWRRRRWVGWQRCWVVPDSVWRPSRRTCDLDWWTTAVRMYRAGWTWSTDSSTIRTLHPSHTPSHSKLNLNQLTPSVFTISSSSFMADFVS